jgi:RNA polymerase sigma factor (sigma-70 family)
MIKSNGQRRSPIGTLVPLRRVEASIAGASDEVLIAACALSDCDAMGTLFDRHSETVYRFLHRLIGEPSADLDDMVHGTFLEAFRSAGRFRGSSSVKSWLLGIAVNVSRHHIRAEIRRRAFLRSWAEREQPRAAQPDHEVEERDLVARIGRALAGLPHNLRVVFILSDLEELSNIEAAKALGLPPGTFGRRLYEARQALRVVLGEEGR